MTSVCRYGLMCQGAQEDFSVGTWKDNAARTAWVNVQTQWLILMRHQTVLWTAKSAWKLANETSAPAGQGGARICCLMWPVLTICLYGAHYP